MEELNVKELEAAIAEELEQKKKARKLAVIKIALLLILSCALLIFGTIAWFASAKFITANISNVKMAGAPYELAVPEDPGNVGAISYIQTGSGSQATYDAGTELNEMSGGVNAGDGTLGSYTYITDIAEGTTDTANFYATNIGEQIKWRLGSEYDKTDDGLGPASYGSFTFYVVPKVSGTIDVNIKLGIDGYQADVERNEDKSFEVDDLTLIGTNDSAYQAVEFLRTHLLFFSGRTGLGTELSPYYYTGLISDDGLELTFNDCVVDRLIPVTIYWIWPNTFAEMTCIAAKGNVADISGNSEATQSVNDIRDYVVTHLDKVLKMNVATALTYLADESTQGGETTYTFSTTKANEKIRELSMGYNDADQLIGTSIQYFLVSLEAD